MDTPDRTGPKANSFTSRDGEMGRLINEFDWTSTPLGPIETWTESLIMTVRVMLANPIPMLLWWGQDYIQIYNDAYRPVLGVKHPKRGLGVPVRECWSEIWHVLKPLIDTPFNGGPATWMEDIELEINRFGFNEETHFVISYSPIFDPAVPSGIGGVMATVMETTDKILSERRLRAMNDLSANVGLAKSPVEACKLAANSLSQHPSEIPYSIFYLVNPGGEAARLASFSGLKETPPLNVTLKNGELPWTMDPRSIALPLLSTDRAEPVGFMIAGIGERRKFDHGYREFFSLAANQVAAAVMGAQEYSNADRSRRDIYEFFTQIPSPLVVLSGPEHRFTVVNEAYERFVARDVLGKTVREAFTDMEVGDFIALLDSVYRTGKPFMGQNLPLSLPDENGVIHHRIINVAYHPVRDADGTIKGILAVHQDVTEQAHAELRLRLAKEDAEKASQMKSAFLANMSHEIRTPLGIILGFIDLLIDPTTPESERARIAGTLKRNGEQLKVIINDILDLSKVEAGELKIDPETFSLRELIEDVSRSFSVRANEKGLYLTTEFPDGEDLKLTTDRVRVKQIVWNLVGNAVKFTEVGGITVSAARNDDLWQLQVRDTGIGIADENRPRLFKPFSQIDQSDTRKYGGTGLGLTLSKKLAQTLNGDLALVQSQPGAGSVFELTLRDLDGGGESEPSDEFNAHVALALKDMPLKDLKVLLIEDSEDNRDLISQVLVKYGAEIAIAENGAEGVKAAENGDHNLILMDLQMPVMDGYSATEALRSKGYKKPIIALSAHAMPEVRRKCIKAGCNDYLAKPINFSLLVAKVRQHTRG